MPTSPASEPFMIVTTSGRRSRSHVSASADQAAERRGERRVQDHRRHVGREPERAAAVEAVPADPQHEHAERRERQVVAPDRDGARGRSARSSGPRMMIAASATQPPTEWTTVDPAKSTKPSSFSQPSEPPRPSSERRVAPRPVAEDRVRDRGDERGQHEVAAEAHPLGDGAGHQRRRGRDEAELEEEERGQEGAVALEEERRRADAGRPRSTPNISPKPNSQKSDAATRKFAKFLIATLIEFFDRTRPLSSAVKPACMSSTSAAQTSSQPMSTGATSGIPSPEPSRPSEARLSSDPSSRTPRNASTHRAHPRGHDGRVVMTTRSR